MTGRAGDKAAAIRISALVDFRAPEPDAASLRLAFGVPRERLVAHALDEIVPLLARVDALARTGAWAVGYLRYEAAAAFDGALATHDAPDGAPLAVFTIHDAPLSA